MQLICAQFNRCATYTAREKEEAIHPEYKMKRASFEKMYLEWSKTNNVYTDKKTDSIFIPLVVHVVWHNSVENISDAQIQSQIDVLNADFNSTNADTVNTPSYFKQRHGVTKFYFRLAKQDPDGLPTNGISRRYTDNDSGFAIDDQVQFTSLGGDDPWDPRYYVNIWICKFSVNTFAYTYFPGGSLRKEGIVCGYRYFGTTGTTRPPYNLGRTVTHEMGHYFNLDHSWGPTDFTQLADCTDDDHVYDTPLQSVANFYCPKFPHISCLPDTSDAYMDYMDYTDDACMNLFTKGQAERMVASYYIMTPELKNSKALMEPVLTKYDAGIKEILSPVDNAYTCKKKMRPRIVLGNYGSETLHSVDVDYLIKGNAITTYTFTGLNLPAYSLDTLDLPLMDITGNGSLTFIALTKKPNGNRDENPLNDKATVVFNYNVNKGLQLPYKENFSHKTFPPEGWSITNPDNYFTWAPTSGSLLSGYAPSIMMDNIEYPEKGETDDLITPAFSFTNAAKPALIFDHAFAMYKPGKNKSDTLQINVSTNCGNTWQTVYYKGGLDLSTAVNGKYGYFSPDSLSQWKRDTIDLTAFANQDNVLIDFKNINGMDNLLYLDNIQVKNLNLREYITQSTAENKSRLQEDVAEIIVSPNPVTNSFTISGINSLANYTIKCFDITGRCVWQTNKAFNESTSFTLPASVVNGVYFLNIIEQDKIFVKKIIVSR